MLDQLVSRTVAADGVVVDPAVRGGAGGSVVLADLLAADEDVTLHGAAAGARARRGVLAQQRLARLALDDKVGDLVGVALVRIAGLADAALELHAAALLDDVGGLVGGGVEVRLAAERDVVAGGEGVGAHGLGAGRGSLVGVGDDLADVVAAEGALDLIDVGKRPAGAAGAVGRGGVDVAQGRDGAAVSGAGQLSLFGRLAPHRLGRRHSLDGQAAGQGPLSGRHRAALDARIGAPGWTGATAPIVRHGPGVGPTGPVLQAVAPCHSGAAARRHGTAPPR